METVRCHVKIMKKFPKFVFWNIFRLEETADEIDVNTVPSFGENESHVPRRRVKLLTFSKRKKVVGTTRVDRSSRTFTPFSRLQVPEQKSILILLTFFFIFFLCLIRAISIILPVPING